MSGDTKIVPTPAQINSLWRNAVHLSDDPYFGLHFGEAMQLSALGVVGQVILTSNTVGEALTQASRLIFLITDIFQIKVEHHASSFTIFLISDTKKSEEFPYTYKQMGEYLLAFVLYELDGLLMRKIEPIKVGLPFDLEDSDEYKRILRTTNISVSDNFNLTLNNSYLPIAIITSNYKLQAHLLSLVDDQLSTKDNKGRLKDKVYNHLLANSYLYTSSLQAVASNFSMSARTMQRRLREEGTTFLEIVEEVHRTLAIKYLDTGDYQVKDIAYTIGYNEPSAFVRAFKRWTGMTPSQFRNRQNPFI